MNDNSKKSNEEEYSSNNLTLTEQRSLIFHFLYALEVSDYQFSFESVIENFLRGFNVVVPSDSYVYQQTLNLIEEKDTLDKMVLPLLSNWRIERLGLITKLIIRIGVKEILNNPNDAPMIINSCIELSKCFGEKDSFKFVNGILDEFSKRQKVN